MKGFLLQPTYRILGGRPVVHLHGVLEDGRSFLVRDGRDEPSFYVRAIDAERAAKLGAERIEATGLRTLDGHAASEIVLRIPSDAPPLRDRLRAHGIRCYEADLRFAVRYLIRHGLRGGIEIGGEGRHEPTARGIDLVFDDPELRPLPPGDDISPRLEVLSMDIETDMRGRSLFSVAFYGRWRDVEVSEVLLWCPEGLDCPADAGCRVEGLATQADMLRATARRIAEIDPDVLTGWNVVDFDLKVLSNLAELHGVRFDVGRTLGDSGNLRLRKTRTPWNTWDASIPGRVVLDGIHLLRSSFVKMDSYGLGAVAQEVLGEGKLIQGSHRGAQIEEAFRHDRKLLVEYNLRDAKLVVDILDRLQLVELAVERSKLTGLAIDRVGGSIAAFDFLYLEQLWRRRLVAPSVEGDAEGGSANLGGHVLEPEAGLWRSVLVFDFKSLYPSIIRTFQIDPLGFQPELRGPAARDRDDLVVAPNGAAFRRQPGILPGLLDDLFPRREAAKRAGDEVASHAIKILMNSFYGVLGTSACRFAHPALACSSTALGRELLLWSKAELERRGYRVLYGDTDSLFVLSGVDDPDAARALGEELAPALNAAVARHIAGRWGVESKLELEFEKLYLQLLLPSMRGGGGGARKRYAGLVHREDGPTVEFTGMEVVRRDWTDLAKTVQRQLYDELFLAEAPKQGVRRYLEKVVREVRAGEHDQQLVYRKALRKPVDEYTATTPPHVAAAKKLTGRPGRMISYVVTIAGPEPVKELHSQPDHEHYVQKQIRPVAEPVLGVLGLDFDEVVGDEVQLSLFD